MLVRDPREVDARLMDMPGAHRVRMRLMVGREHGAPTFAMRLFEVEPGGHTPRHAHNYEHEVMILDGVAGVFDGDAEREVSAGQAVYIPANQTHQFTNRGEGTLRFLCVVPTHFDCGTDSCVATPGS